MNSKIKPIFNYFANRKLTKLLNCLRLLTGLEGISFYHKFRYTYTYTYTYTYIYNY